MKESVYLYGEEGRDLYQDFLNNGNKQDCLFSRNLFAYLERGSEVQSPFYEKHLLECPICQAKASKWEQLLKVVDQNIPEEKMETSTLEFLESECANLAEVFGKQKIIDKRNRKKESLEAIKSALLDLVKMSYHPNILKAALVALILGYLISYIL